jgi:ATP-dependent DNA helicase RecQ
MAEIHDILKRYWGYDSFRPLQEDIINSVLEGKDTLGLMPTGGGKSITFQVPALTKEGTAIVITPLISLMKDQVDHLRELNIKATYIHSGMSRRETNIALENCIFGNYKFLYVSPERLSSEMFLEKFRQMNISMIVVDEAHCISQWGYDFRPAYVNIADIRKIFPEVPTLALTATATPEVVKDIQNKLLFKKENVFTKSFARKNIAYVVRDTDDKSGELIRILSRVNGCAIVYVRNRKRTKEVALELQSYGISADFFHAGLGYEDKNQKQQRWKDDECRVIVATNAFGMGIDKPDVRVVVHMDLPNSPEEYFQEAGRAGRDGKKAYAVILYSKSDKTKLNKRIADAFPEKEFIKRCYDTICNYYEVAVGSGDGLIKEFDINKFCSIYKFPILTTYNAIKIIELCGYIEYVENVDSAARMMFLVSRDELYSWQSTHPNEDIVLECAMRSYSGMFTEYAYINEEQLSRRSALSHKEVCEALISLSRQRIIHYIPRKQNPYIFFSAPREATKYVHIRKDVYEERKERFEKRIESMITYATHDKKCRQLLLLEYFGEKNGKECCICDNCLKTDNKDVEKREFSEIETKLYELLENGTYNINQIVNSLPYDRDKVIEVVRFLVDEGYIIYEEPQYRLK